MRREAGFQTETRKSICRFAFQQRVVLGIVRVWPCSSEPTAVSRGEVFRTNMLSSQLSTKTLKNLIVSCFCGCNMVHIFVGICGSTGFPPNESSEDVCGQTIVLWDIVNMFFISSKFHFKLMPKPESTHHCCAVFTDLSSPWSFGPQACPLP